VNKPNPHPDFVASEDDNANRVELRQDAAGRYCLSDLHKAAGGSSRHDPSNYLGLDETQELIMLLREEAIIHGTDPIAMPNGPDGPIFVSDELAISYTVWLSPQARLAVYSGFRAHRERSIGAEADVTSTAEMLGQTMEDERERQARGGRAKPN